MAGKGPGSKGNGVSGKGLDLRLKGFADLKNAQGFTKPGSQNVRKGGPGTTRLKRADFPKKKKED
jgi:hypothetical protein